MTQDEAIKAVPRNMIPFDIVRKFDPAKGDTSFEIWDRRDAKAFQIVSITKADEDGIDAARKFAVTLAMDYLIATGWKPGQSVSEHDGPPIEGGEVTKSHLPRP